MQIYYALEFLQYILALFNLFLLIMCVHQNISAVNSFSVVIHLISDSISTGSKRY